MPGASAGDAAHGGWLGWYDGLRLLGRDPRWRRWAGASILGRLPVVMEPLALLLAGHALSGSFAVGAGVAAASLVVFGVAAPLRGRRLDRRDLAVGLRRDLRLGAACSALQVLVVAVAGPVWLLAVAAIGSSLAYAVVEGGFRALLPLTVSRRDLERANAVEAVLGECCFVVAPALVGVLTLTAGAAGVLAVMALLAVSSAGRAGRLPSRAPAPVHREELPWRLPRARATYAVALVAGAGIGAFEAGLPARVAQLGLEPGLAGIYLAVAYAGSVTGGLVVSGIGEGADFAASRAATLLAAFAAVLTVVAATSAPGPLALAVFVAGMPLAPLSALGTMVLQREVPPASHAAAFSTFFAALSVGAGLGNALTAAWLEAVGSVTLLAAAAVLCAFTAGVLAVAARRGGRGG